MDANQVVSDAKTKFGQAVERFKDGLKTLRTGRANAGMLDGVMVEAYDTKMPLNQVATIAIPEPQLIQLTPFDPNNLGAIADAIRNDSSLGLNPTDDGRVIRVPIPPLTEERRRELAKQVGQKQEECMIVLRNVRHDAMDTLNQAKKDKDISEDEAKRLSGQVDDALNKARGDAEAAAKSKESEIMSIGK
ncbi:MAG TPA: ribosome recycling factor [Candidatus Saccharimonadales bacterium]|nr:ribosome recycling factor [Candidatus Saccharimonadales bacterium]